MITQSNLMDRPLPRTADNELLKELSVFSAYLTGSKKAIIDSDEQIKTAGAELTNYLKEEYHLA